MAQNFLFMFEFVVDEVMVFKPNKCAPEEYPTYCELTFRKNVFVSICYHEYGQYIDPCKPKCGKSCLFSLESPIKESDKLYIHVYKKKTEKCKFLIGFTNIAIKNVYDKAMESFNIQNPNWEDILSRHVNTILISEEQKKSKGVVDNDCESNDEERHEQLCPTSELKKQLLPIFNNKRCQTGNVVLLLRLVAIGPAIVSTFPFSRFCYANCNINPPNSSSKKCEINKIECTNLSRFEGGMDNEDNNPCGSKKYKPSTNAFLSLRDPSHKELKKTVCQRYFACNADKSCPFDEIEDDIARAAKFEEQKQKISRCPQPEPPNSCCCEECIDECEADDACLLSQDQCDALKCKSISAETCGDSITDRCSPADLSMQPCFRTPTKPYLGPDAYDEFEACLNGSGLVIRVLKDTHQVENICDGTENFVSECKDKIHVTGSNLPNYFLRSNFARDRSKRQTGGHIINHPNLPKIRANIKYSGNGDYHMAEYNVPYSKIKIFCDNQSNKINNYRTHRSRRCISSESDICQPKHQKDERNCCVQADREDIQNFMKDLEQDTRKKGIEVCYKTCDETDSDVFLVKLGSKRKSEHKKNNIVIELKTPKMPVITAKQYVTTDTQITEKELDEALVLIKKAKTGKGKRNDKAKTK